MPDEIGFDKKFIFEVEFTGIGRYAEEAWEDALRNFDPGIDCVPPVRAVEDIDEEDEEED